MPRPYLPRRVFATLTLALAGACASASAQSLSYLGQQILQTGATYAGTTIGGLSGLDYVPSTGRYLAISDDRSAVNPARYYDVSLDLTQFVRSGTPGSAGLQFQSVTTIQRPDGSAFPANTLDPESIRRNPLTGNLVWSNEGQRVAGDFQNPTVREMTPAGAYVRDYAVPDKFLPTGTAGGVTPGDRGIFNNLAFESLTFSPDGAVLYTATENALVQDGPIASISNGSNARILAFNAVTGAAGAEYVYPVTPVARPPVPAGGFSTNGLVELIATGDRQFIAMERSFAIGATTPGVGPNGLPTGYTVRLYAVDARGATDVSGRDSLAAGPYVPVTKTLLLDLSDLRNDDGSVLALDNLEGMSLGPIVNGKQTLILVSDNNFGSTQFTQFVALAITPVPEVSSAALLAVGLAGVLIRARRWRREDQIEEPRRH
jgi:hypothetical protein